MPEEKKQRLKEYQKKLSLKSLNIIIIKIVLIVYAAIYAKHIDGYKSLIMRNKHTLLGFYCY